MYDFYMGKVLLPISPSKMQTVINNQNKTVNLMNEGEVNLVKEPGLTVYKFDIILPLYTNYPFARYKSGFQPAGYYLAYFEKLKINGTPFEFKVNRFKEEPFTKTKQNIMPTNKLVVLENYVIMESADSAPDIEVSIELKEYVKYGTIVKEIDTKTNTVKNSVVKKEANKAIPNTYTVKKGDTLWAIAKKLLGDGAKCWNLAKLNNISNPNRIRPGQVLKIQDVKATTAPASTTAKSASTNNTAAKSATTKSTTTVKTVTPSAAKANAMLKNPFLISSYEKQSPLTYEGALNKIIDVRSKREKGLVQTPRVRR